MSREQRSTLNSLEEKFFFEENQRAIERLKKEKSQEKREVLDSQATHAKEHQRIQEAIKNVLTTSPKR